MECDKAWQEFENTGKVESYLKYRKIKEKFNEEIGIIKGENSEVIQGKRNSN